MSLRTTVLGQMSKIRELHDADRSYAVSTKRGDSTTRTGDHLAGAGDSPIGTGGSITGTGHSTTGIDNDLDQGCPLPPLRQQRLQTEWLDDSTLRGNSGRWTETSCSENALPRLYEVALHGGYSHVMMSVMMLHMQGLRPIWRKNDWTDKYCPRTRDEKAEAELWKEFEK
ncbi:hypothetical protein Tco_0059204 [Tanacetum coccineum]